MWKKYVERHLSVNMLFLAYLCMRCVVVDVGNGLVCRNVIYVVFCVLVVFGNGFISFILIT